MATCIICGKTNVAGVSQRHKRGVAGKRWAKRAQETKRLFVANIQKKSVMIDGIEQKVNICTKCIKRIKKFGSTGKYKHFVLA